MKHKLLWLGLSVAVLSVAGLLLSLAFFCQAPKSAAEIAGTYAKIQISPIKSWSFAIMERSSRGCESRQLPM